MNNGMRNITREEFAIDFMDSELSDEQLISIWNQHCEMNLCSNTIYPNDEYIINDLISTGDKTALEVWRMFSGDYNECADYIIYDDHGYFRSFDNPRLEMETSEMTDAFFESEWCDWKNDDFCQFVVKDVGMFDPDFAAWISENKTSDDEWEDLEELYEEYEDFLKGDEEETEDED